MSDSKIQPDEAPPTRRLATMTTPVSRSRLNPNAKEFQPLRNIGTDDSISSARTWVANPTSASPYEIPPAYAMSSGTTHGVLDYPWWQNGGDAAQAGAAVHADALLTRHDWMTMRTEYCFHHPYFFYYPFQYHGTDNLGVAMVTDPHYNALSTYYPYPPAVWTGRWWQPAYFDFEHIGQHATVSLPAVTHSTMPVADQVAEDIDARLSIVESITRHERSMPEVSRAAMVEAVETTSVQEEHTDARLPMIESVTRDERSMPEMEQEATRQDTSQAPMVEAVETTSVEEERPTTCCNRNDENLPLSQYEEQGDDNYGDLRGSEHSMGNDSLESIDSPSPNADIDVITHFLRREVSTNDEAISVRSDDDSYEDEDYLLEIRWRHKRLSEKEVLALPEIEVKARKEDNDQALTEYTFSFESSNYYSALYEEADKDEDDVSTSCHNSGCPICLEDFVPGEKVCLLPRCRHAFHTDHIVSWLTTGPGCCPLCKTNVLERSRGNDEESDLELSHLVEPDSHSEEEPVSTRISLVRRIERALDRLRLTISMLEANANFGFEKNAFAGEANASFPFVNNAFTTGFDVPTRTREANANFQFENNAFTREANASFQFVNNAVSFGIDVPTPTLSAERRRRGPRPRRQQELTRIPRHQGGRRRSLRPRQNFQRRI